MIPRWPLIVLALTLLMPIGCGTLDVAHVSAFRDLQDDFNDAATFENRENLHALSADTTTWNRADLVDRASPITAGLSLVEAERLHRDYYRVFTETDALLANAETKLVQDRLAVNALTLRLLARWRMAFYGHLVGVLRGDTPVATFNPNGEGAPESLNAVLAAARSTRATILSLRENQPDTIPFPRDEFIVEALASGGYLRFDIAYIGALRAAHRQALGSRRPSNHALALMEQMARAESELAAVTTSSPHLRSHVIRSRLLMLAGAQALALETNFDWLDEGMPARLPTLRSRLEAIHAEQAATPGPINDALAVLTGTNTLATVVGPRPPQ